MSKKILIVDDDLDLCRILQAHFEMLGYVSILAVNGKEAVDLATSQVPDLIIMDILLPVMDGLQATRLIREDPKTQSIPILAMTAKTTLKDKEDCIQSGCDDFLEKPFPVKKLTSIIEKLFSQNSNLSTVSPSSLFCSLPSRSN